VAVAVVVGADAVLLQRMRRVVARAGVVARV